MTHPSISYDCDSDRGSGNKLDSQLVTANDSSLGGARWRTVSSEAYRSYVDQIIHMAKALTMSYIHEMLIPSLQEAEDQAVGRWQAPSPAASTHRALLGPAPPGCLRPLLEQPPGLLQSPARAPWRNNNITFLTRETPFTEQGETVIGFYLLALGWMSWFGNSIVMFVLYKQRAVLQPTDYLTFNLAVSDASISVFGYSRGIIEIFNVFRDDGFLITSVWTCQSSMGIVCFKTVNCALRYWEQTGKTYR
uniref:Uncharacterized protein n=1 Tax=Sphaerodactylus townsendi TaxID=933632 RepID=A0ACB8GAM9_9SAUR